MSANGVGWNANYPRTDRSRALLQRARARIPAATQTLAKGPTQFVQGACPAYLERGEGARVWDVDGNEFIDFTMAVGPVSLGYGFPAVDRAIREQLDKGITFSLMHPLEVEVAELISEVVPHAERVRFSKTGADVTSAAVRLARAHTGRKRVACCGYHGWHDWYVSTTSRSTGVPQETSGLVSTFQYNDIASAEAVVTEETACVILEPMLFESPRNNFLRELRELCDRKGALLIFDEMWTGFRLALGGAQERFDVRADLATFSKAVANGMPLSVLTGRADVMDRLDTEVFFFTTFGGEALSLAAAKATIETMRDHDVSGYLNRLGEMMRDGLNGLLEKKKIDWARCIGAGCRSLVTFSPAAGDPLEVKSFAQQELARRGVLWSGMHVMSFSHGEADIEYALEAYDEVLDLLKSAVSAGEVRQRLRGPAIQPVFRTLTGKRP